MINHVRTLLLGVSGANSPGFELAGEEFVDPEFRPIPLPTYLQAIRRTLFGVDPDRLMLNYRLKQLLEVIHATELVDYVTFLDPRISYDLAANDDFDTRVTFGPSATRVGDTASDLAFVGENAAPDTQGRILHAFDVRLTDADTVLIHRQTPPASLTSIDLTFSDGLSQPVSLPGTGWSFRTAGGAGDRWAVTVLLRPQKDLGELTVAIENLGERVLLPLFGAPSVEEPFRTFRRLWYEHEAMPYRLGAAVLATAYRIEEIRRG